MLPNEAQDNETGISHFKSYALSGESVQETVIIQDAVIRNIEIIGEVSKRVSDGFKEQHDNVPWRKMAGIRDVLIHDYDSIDMSIVWNVVSIELPKIMLSLSSI